MLHIITALQGSGKSRLADDLKALVPGAVFFDEMPAKKPDTWPKDADQSTVFIFTTSTNLPAWISDLTTPVDMTFPVPEKMEYEPGATIIDVQAFISTAVARLESECPLLRHLAMQSLQWLSVNLPAAGA